MSWMSYIIGNSNLNQEGITALTGKAMLEEAPMYCGKNNLYIKELAQVMQVKGKINREKASPKLTPHLPLPQK